MMKALRDKKGFTLVEILVVLAILAILIAVAVPSLSGALQDAREKTVLARARAAYIAYELVSATSDTVTGEDIASIMGDSAPDEFTLAVKTEGGAVTHFYYTDRELPGKHVDIVMGGEAVIVPGDVSEEGILGIRWVKPVA